MIERLAMIPRFLFHILGLTICMIILAILGFTWSPIAWVITGDGTAGLDWMFNWVEFHVEYLV